MENSNTTTNWAEIKGKIRAKWGKLTDDEIETFKGNLDQIKGKIQKAYGYAVDKVEAEFNEFKQSLAGKFNDKVEKSGVLDRDTDSK